MSLASPSSGSMEICLRARQFTSSRFELEQMGGEQRDGGSPDVRRALESWRSSARAQGSLRKVGVGYCKWQMCERKSTFAGITTD